MLCLHIFSLPIRALCQPPVPRSPGLIAHPTVRERVVHEDSVSTHRGGCGGNFFFFFSLWGSFLVVVIVLLCRYCCCSLFVCSEIVFLYVIIAVLELTVNQTGLEVIICLSRPGFACLFLPLPACPCLVLECDFNVNHH